MKYSFLVLFALLATKATHAIELKPDQNFAYELIDYTHTPIYKQIKKHPENYLHLDQVNLYRILYKSDSLQITGLMAAPKAEGKFPMVVYNRGGNRNLGQLLVGTATDILGPIAAEGYVVVASNYRGSGSSQGHDEFGGDDVNDVINLIKTAAVFEKADTSRIGLLGISRGGMMNYLVLKKMNESGIKISCAISIGGITDLEKTIEFHPEIGAVCEEIIPRFAEEKNAALIQRSAVYWVNQLPDSCPLLLLHSFDDAAVTYLQIPTFADSLEAHQKPYKLISFQNDNHGIAHHRKQVMDELLNWFEIYLKSAAINPGLGERNVIE